MLKVTRLGLAAALILGSASVAFAQVYEAGPGTETAPPNSAGIYVGSAPHQVAPRAGRRHGQPSVTEDESQQPWSSSLDPGMAGGGF